MEQREAVEVLKSLKERGIRFTPQRQAILEYLLSTDTHPTAEEIFKQVKARFPGVSLGTVYNTLNMLKENNYILELFCGDASSRFDGNHENHYHVVCESCGKVEDLPQVNLVNMDELVEARTGFCVETHRLVFYGTCPECNGHGEHQGTH